MAGEARPTDCKCQTQKVSHVTPLNGYKPEYSVHAHYFNWLCLMVNSKTCSPSMVTMR